MYPLKWNRVTIIAVLSILLISYAYSSIKDRQLSNKIKEERLRICAEQGDYDCNLILQFHNECFKSSYRSQYKIKKFYLNEYNNCINRKIEQFLNPKEN